MRKYHISKHEIYAVICYLYVGFLPILRDECFRSCLTSRAFVKKATAVSVVQESCPECELISTWDGNDPSQGSCETLPRCAEARGNFSGLASPKSAESFLMPAAHRPKRRSLRNERGEGLHLGNLLIMLENC